MLSVLKGSGTGAQFRRYSVVGVSGFIVDFGLYAALTRLYTFWNTYNLAANAVSFSCAVVNNFIWHRRWTFRDHPEPDAVTGGDAAAILPSKAQARPDRQFVTFVIVSVIGLGLNTLILRLVSHQPHVQAMFNGQADLFAKVVAVPIVWMWNFGANKFVTFRKG